MHLVRGNARQRPLTAKSAIALAATALLTACAGDAITAPQLKPEPATANVSLYCGSRIRADEPIRYFVDGKLIQANALQALNPDQIASIEVRRRTEGNPYNEVHVIMRSPRQ